MLNGLGSPAQQTVTLGDRYELERGVVFMTGVQALTRVVLDQLRRDARAGLRTAAFASGYQGSPLGTFDSELQRVRRLGEPLGLVHRPGLNEELAATSVWGTQLAHTLPGAKHDGVIGFWYGKSPGLDRAADAIRHGNFVGTTPTGGVVAFVGDDPSCKSSSLPSASEGILASLRVPVLYPGTLEEALDFGLHAVACSRAAGT
jgi:indolepyruvate ferredoxin oxidoreductase